MSIDNRTPQEKAYDAMRDGSAYFPPALPRQVADDDPDVLLGREVDDILTAIAGPETTLRERIEAIMHAGGMPSGDQIFDLLKEDQIAHYIWYRALDWVLYRQRQGLPVMRMDDRDDTAAAIDARYQRAWDAYHNLAQWPADLDVDELGASDVIDRWKRGGRQHEDTDVIIQILELLDGGEDEDTCPDCEGAGCSTCDGSPLTDQEVAEQ